MNHEHVVRELSGSRPEMQTGLAARALALVCGATVAFFLLQILTFGYGRDQGIYAMVARAILDGGMPYRDAWDFKPPGVFVVYAIARAIFGSNQMGIRWLEVLGLLAMAWTIVRLAEDWWGDRRVGWIAAALAIMVHSQLDFWHTAQPESFGGMATMAALWLGTGAPSTAASRGRRYAAWIGSGALLGFAFLLKPPLAGTAVVVVAVHLARAWRTTPGDLAIAARRASTPTACLVAGAALPIALCLAWFGARGALRDLYETLFVFTPHYTAIGWQGVTVLGMSWEGFSEWFVSYSSVLTVGLLFLLGYRPTEAERPAVFVLLGVIALHVVGVVMQAKFFPYHYGATWPPTAMLAALAYTKVWDRAWKHGPLGALVAFGLLIALSFGRSATRDTPDSFLARCAKRIGIYTSSPRDLAALDKLATVADVDAGTNRAVAAALRERVPEGRSVFVWGFEPVIYDLANRRPASRFLYDVPQRVAWAKPEMRRILMDDLAKDPPAAIVVEHRDVFPMVTGSYLDSADELSDFPELQGYLDRGYVQALRVEDLQVFVARNGAPGGVE